MVIFSENANIYWLNAVIVQVIKETLMKILRANTYHLLLMSQLTTIFN